MILALDPGNTHTAGVILSENSEMQGGPDIIERFYLPNEDAADTVDAASSTCNHMAIEMIACYGMAVGREVFDTCVWIGRFIERFDSPFFTQVFRRDVKLYLCNSAKAKDANVRQALIDLYGGRGATKKGAPLHGVSGDIWAALGVGVTYLGKKELEKKWNGGKL
jgi:hypothetical protein